MSAARDEGKVRFIGVTGHDWVEVAKAVATGLFDTVLCWYNCALREAELTVFVEAAKHNTGVVIMNASRNDRLFDYVRPRVPPAPPPSAQAASSALRNPDLLCGIIATIINSPHPWHLFVATEWRGPWLGAGAAAQACGGGG